MKRVLFIKKFFGVSAYYCEGKIPNSEIMKLTARNGDMLSCG